MKRADFETLHKWAEDCMTANAYFDSRSAFKLISKLAKEAAGRGQRKKHSPSDTEREPGT